jgi:hypothetical protein
VQLSAAYRAAHTARPVQPLAADSPGRVVLRRARVRDLSARVLGLTPEGEDEGAWRAAAAAEGVARSAARKKAALLLAEHAAALERAAAQPPPPLRSPEEIRGIFPDWRRARPPLRPGKAVRYVSGGVAAQRAAQAAAFPELALLSSSPAARREAAVARPRVQPPRPRMTPPRAEETPRSRAPRAPRRQTDAPRPRSPAPPSQTGSTVHPFWTEVEPEGFS